MYLMYMYVFNLFTSVLVSIAEKCATASGHPDATVITQAPVILLFKFKILFMHEKEHLMALFKRTLQGRANNCGCTFFRNP